MQEQAATEQTDCEKSRLHISSYFLAAGRSPLPPRSRPQNFAEKIVQVEIAWDSEHAYHINDWLGGIRAPTPPQKQGETPPIFVKWQQQRTVHRS